MTFYKEIKKPAPYVQKTVPYFYVVFTVAGEIGGHPRIVFGVLFQVTGETLQTIGDDRRYLAAIR